MDYRICDFCCHKIVCSGSYRSFAMFENKCKYFMNKEYTKTPKQIQLATEKGTITAYAFENDDGYRGIRTEFLTDDDQGQYAGRPQTSLEITPENELQIVIYGRRSEDPIDDFPETMLMSEGE